MRTLLLLFLFLPYCSWAQLVDDFSDGDFTADPVWTGTDTSFIVNTGKQLQSAATAAGEAWLSTSVANMPLNDAMEWRFWIREGFSPSANNYAEVWLLADSACVSRSSAGYFLRFGAAGSKDAIELYRRDGAADTLICKGIDAAIAAAFKVAVKVHRDREGHWKVLTDYENAGCYALEAEGMDDHELLGGYFGVSLKFTSSNAKKFYFDDVYVGPEIIDLEPPELRSLETPDVNHLLLTFSESLSENALDPQHYRVVTSPDSVSFDGNPFKVLLSFNESLPENTNLQLTVTDVSDLVGNVMPETTWDFCIYKATENDVVINEIMADPTPVVGLPEWEYLELFNTTAFRIDLTGWILALGNSEKVFPVASIDPEGFLILCKTEAVEALSVFGPTCGFSSFSIANAGAVLRLLKPEGEVVSEVSFSSHWYHDADKKDGGWSLEQIDPYNPCAGTLNWSASTDASGGTPGRVNAIHAPNAFAPRLDRISMSGDDQVLVWFDQQMDRASISDPAHYRVIELDVSPIEVVCSPLDASSVRLQFAVPFREGELYTLSVQEVANCSGNLIEAGAQRQFGIPWTIEASAVLINEILFDPIAPGVDYVELYNPSEKAFDLSELKLGVIKESFPNPPDTVLKEITQESVLMLPHSYLLLSTDGYTVAHQYGCALADYVDMPSFPTYPNAGGEALLMSRQGVVVDQMTFSPSMHYPLLKETKGVSLERVSWAVPSAQADNWHSAAEAVHFGTPGYANSMRVEGVAAEAEEVKIAPEVFSPDGDGLNDCCVVSYALEGVGATMNVYVFAVNGQLVRHLVRGELVGAEGHAVWNGLDGRGRRVPLGLYVMVVELMKMDGHVSRHRLTVGVASR